MRFSLAVVAAVATLALSACAPQAKIERLHQDPEARGADYQRLLVVGISSDAEQRRRIEDLVTEQLEAARVSAVAGHTRLGLAPAVLQESIDQAASETGSDAILISHVVSVSTTAEVVEGRVDVISECRGGDPADYFLYDHHELREPDSVRFANEVVMVTSLYDTATEKRMWTIQSTCFEKADLDDVLQSEAKAIVKQLRRDGLIG